jgi:hypothetical protein
MSLGEVGAHHDDHRVLAEPPRELVGVGHRPRRVAEPGLDAPGRPARAGDGLGAGTGSRGDLFPQREIPLTQLRPQRRVPHEHEADRAPVAAVRREPRQLNGPEQHLIRNWIVPVVPARVLRAHRLVQFHRHLTMRRCHAPMPYADPGHRRAHRDGIPGVALVTNGTDRNDETAADAEAPAAVPCAAEVRT